MLLFSNWNSLGIVLLENLEIVRLGDVNAEAIIVSIVSVDEYSLNGEPIR